MARLRQGKGSTFAGVARAVKRVRRWRGTQSTDIIASLGTLNKTLLAPADYEQSTSLEPSGVTVATVRGSFSIQADTAVAIAGAWCLGVYDLGETKPSSVGTVVLTDEDILAAGTFCASPEHCFHYEFHVKTLRKLHNDQVVLTIDNNIAGTGIMQLVSRVLVLGG